MIKRTLTYTSLLTLLFFISCNTSKDKDSATYFGGKIINPKSKFVTLHSMEKIIDTLFLDENNSFLSKLDNLNEGLYYFIHGNENQYIYLEPKDSLMLRLNTWDFDESLVFAGTGAERNNILIDCFLEEEKDDKATYKFNKLAPKEFKEKTDSLIRLKLATYNKYVENHPEETLGFNNLLKVALTYPIYSRVERYPIMSAKYSKTKEFPKTDGNFYDYRNEITINKDSLMYYGPYSKYVKNFLYNTTYALGHKPMTNEYSTSFTNDLLNTIDAKISSTESKNAFLKQTVIGHFYRKSTCNVDEKAFNNFFKLSTNKDDINQIRLLLNDSKYLERNKKIIDFTVTDFNNGKYPIDKVIDNKSTCLLFWNPEYFTKSYISSRINFLSDKFPEIQFIQIKFDCNSSDRIHNLDIKNQFFIDKESVANNFLTSKMPRAILIDNNGKIVNAFASISSNNIYSQLKELSKN
ncbi:hypothetical protein H9W90_06085 [Polaribacter pectinis]|uniref:Thioredoxin domain-containing protein n=1 Tax=Polaribacter pectinis TaxID=2738844 RepID=A0A7G9LDI6_9FLAO|nr:hypothetical protein [Polaribacter pectinis]QNM86685.1 hypothetical protein H9W90_06085 [Polaribacter pectinis]